MYTLKLVVENQVGRVVLFTDVDVQEIIEELSITYNATGNYLSTKESYKFTSDIEYGTSVSLHMGNFYPVQNESNVRAVDAEKCSCTNVFKQETYIIKINSE